VDTCDGAELVEQEAVHAPLCGKHPSEFLVEVFHLPLDESEALLGVLEDGGLGVSVLLLVLLEDDVVDGLSELTPVVLP
jgi:hypothetical protein